MSDHVHRPDDQGLCPCGMDLPRAGPDGRGLVTPAERMAEIRARIAAATPGTWKGDRFDGTVKYEVVGAGRDSALDDRYPGDPALVLRVDHKNGTHGFIGPLGDANERLVINAPADLAWLVARVEALESALREHEWCSYPTNIDGYPTSDEKVCRSCGAYAQDGWRHEPDCALSVLFAGRAAAEARGRG